MVVCAGCSSHVWISDTVCPHCGHRRGSGGSPTAGVLLLGLLVTGVGCPESHNVDYGTSATDFETDTDADTDSDTDTDPTGDTGTP